MKKFIVPLIFILLFSCQQIDLQYSCDPDINQIVIENLEEFSKIDVVELAVYDNTLQKAIFNSWDYKKKREVWLNKLNIVLSGNDFSDSEVEHINKLINHIEPNYFTEEYIHNNSKNIVQFADKWIKYASEELNWTKEFVAFLVYRIYTEQSQFEDEISMLHSLDEIAALSSENCNCSVSNDYCSNYVCKSNGCSETRGCGWLFTQTCDGLCGNY